MPRLWTETMDAHRQAVGHAIQDTTAALVAERGLASVTMSEIAETTGIGRATLYKYFPDIDAILVAWHERRISTHVDHLAEVRDHTRESGRQLEAVLRAYALISHQGDDTDLGAVLHLGEHVGRARQHLQTFLRDLIDEGAERGELRNDVPPDELAGYCLHALAAAGGATSKAAVHRLVQVVLAGLRREV